jgi:hypothetical protein
MSQLELQKGPVQVSSDLVVAVLGAGGSMGSGLARNIARAGIGVRAWNRTRAAAEPLAGDGAVVTWLSWLPARTSSGRVCNPSSTRWASGPCGWARPARDRG